MQNRALVLILVATSQLRAQASTPEFEVASVKEADGAAMRMGARGGPGTSAPGTWTAENLPAIAFLMLAYRVPRQMISGPAWLTTERYNIDARLRRGAPRKTSG
jgi:uncharacterized protein (TIGR03435 family)